MKNLKSHFRFNQQERSGIFFLLLVIVLVQVCYFFFVNFPGDVSTNSLVVDQELQTRIDRLKKAASKKDSVKIYPFNPNFITDYKGYVLGMSTDEIDRLHAFRQQNRFANTSEEFQQVTQVSDSLLDAISPYFKFPEWTTKKKRPASGSNRYVVGGSSNRTGTAISVHDSDMRKKSAGPQRPPASLKDLNSATAEDLKTVNGIGEKLSARIVKFRDRLGGFLVDEQLYDVYGLEPEVVERTFNRFKVLQSPDIQKININTASAKNIASLVYIQKLVAERIVDYRNVNGRIVSFEELKKIEGFPSDKISRIALYLSL